MIYTYTLNQIQKRQVLLVFFGETGAAEASVASCGGIEIFDYFDADVFDFLYEELGDFGGALDGVRFVGEVDHDDLKLSAVGRVYDSPFGLDTEVVGHTTFVPDESYVSFGNFYCQSGSDGSTL